MTEVLAGNATVAEVDRLKAEVEELKARLAATEQELHEALHDDLTGAPLRKLFAAQVDALIEDASHQDKIVLVHFLFDDVRNMKIMNDTLGHDRTDVLLKALGAASMEVQQDGYAFGRLGGDEFLTVLIGGTTEQAREFGNKIKDRAFEIFTQEVFDKWEFFHPKGDAPVLTKDAAKQFAAKWFSVTVGVASAPADKNFAPSEIREYLVEKSDFAMYKNKDLQKLTTLQKTIQSQIDLAETVGLNVTPSLEWMNLNARKNSRVEREFRTSLASFAEQSRMVGKRAINANEPWMVSLFGETPLLEPPLSRDARLHDVAFIAAKRLEFGVMDPHEIFPAEVFERELGLAVTVDAIRTYDYAKAGKLCATGFGISDPSNPDAGWDTILEAPAAPKHSASFESYQTGGPVANTNKVNLVQIEVGL